MRFSGGAMHWLFGVAGSLVMVAALSAGELYWHVLPPRAADVAIPELGAPAQVVFDQDGVPRISAASLRDAAAALGYVHARDRMFQMELMRRLATGRLAEWLGPAALPMDREMRTLGLARLVRGDFAALSPDAKAMLVAYADGVNAWIHAHGRLAAPELLAFGAPAPWTPEDSLLWGRLMGLWLSMNWREELARWRLEGRMSRAAILALWPRQNEPGQPDRPLQQAMADPATVRQLAETMRAFPAPLAGPVEESNAWAVDGRLSTTGAPLLAGDPHLQFGFPSLWYLVRIDTPEGTLAGASAPGVPGVVLGHNAHIAWSFTTTGADVQDIFVETPVGSDSYATPNGPEHFAVREERIKVRGAPDEILKVRATRHGPVISDLFDTHGPVLAVEMANLAPRDRAAEGLLMLNRAQTVEDAGKAATLITSPVQNLLVADRSKIALYVTGQVPIRKAGDGAMPVAGASGAYDWIGFASGAQLPHYVAPPSGVLVNANEPVAPPDFPVFMGRDAFSDWRAQRIRAMLAAGGRHTVGDFARMQADVTSEMARTVLPALLSVPTPAGLAAKARDLLVGWDGQMRMDVPQPLIFEAWVDRFYLLLRDRLGAGAAMAPVAEFVPSALLPGGARFCGGDCAKLLTQALAGATTELATRFGPDPSAWRWGVAHHVVFADPVIAHLPLIGRLGRISMPVPGSATTVFATASGPEDFTAVLGPEYRGAYDLADLDRSRFMLAPGQSGDVFSPAARTFLDRWRDGATITLTRAVDHVSARILLSP